RKAEEDEPVKRSGCSLGILAVTALGFIGFRRRK
ncbi:GlyGly-CTERM sorting domain-containing protein, partial [Photobacterium sp. CAIM 1938]|nr:GlyGly-CTERM sorting domain-containing protein [Photobacterium lucens]